MSGAAGRVSAIVAPLADAAGLDLVDVQLKGAGSRTLLRIVVDRKGGVDLDACQQLSRRISSELDDADPLEGRYVLEVTSPGVDHPLEGQRAFDRVQGRAVLVHRRTEADSVVQVRGNVLAANPDDVVLDVDGDHVAIGYGDIVKATQALPW